MDANERAVREERPSRTGGVSLVLLGGAVFAVSFLFRFMVQPELTNDFFMHVIGGRQMLLGEWPVRDFYELGMPLTHTMSALAEWLGGPTLMSEVTVSLVFLSLGTVLVFFLAAEASRSRVIGLLATLPVVLVAPFLFAYPKLFCYPLAVWVMWRYLDRPDTLRMLWLGAATAVAFLFRHDHGVYIGLAVAAMLVVRHWPRGVGVWSRAVGTYSLVVVLFLSPYLVFVQVHGGLISYLQTGVEFSLVRMGRTEPEWTLRSEARQLPIQVRWSPDVAGDDAARGASEQRFHLGNPEHRAGATWRYILGDPSQANVRALLNHPAVEDTDGIDRARGEAAGLDEASGQRLLRRLRRQAPTVAGAVSLTAANAIPILFYLVYALPLGAIGLVIYRSILSRPAGRRPGAGETARILGLAFLAVTANVGLLRDAPETRVADVVALPAIVGAWLAGVAFNGPGLRWTWLRALLSGMRSGASLGKVAHTVGRGVAALSVLLVLGAVCVAAGTRGGLAANWLERTELDGGVSAAAVVASITAAIGELTMSPAVDGYMPVEELRPLVRYIYECTRPGDRVFVTGLFPDVVFFSGRGFAGGHTLYMRDQHRSPRAQRLTVDRLQRQSVPLALLHGGVDAHPPLVAEHFRTWYRPVTTIHPAAVRNLTVMVDRRRVPSGRYAPLDAPCFS